MKLLSFKENKVIKPGVLVGKDIFDLSKICSSIKDYIIENGNDFSHIAEAINEEKLSLVDTNNGFSYMPPIVFPNKLLCVAGNYRDHLKEGGADASKQKELTQAPWLFLVPPTTVMVGHNENVTLPKKHNQIDYEGELAFVISKNAKDISESDAKDYIAGYTIFNDVSERTPFMIEEVEKPRQLSFWYKKSFDTFGPCGPWMVTADEIKDPQNLNIQVSINGEKKQDCNTSEMIFGVYKLIEFLSSFMTLEAGDIVSTGTPAGVGLGTGQYLKPDDFMQIEIDGLGILENQLKENS